MLVDVLMLFRNTFRSVGRRDDMMGVNACQVNRPRCRNEEPLLKGKKKFRDNDDPTKKNGTFKP